MKNLSDMQKRRLAGASQEALSKRQQWHLAQITGAGSERADELRFDMMVADSRFLSLLAVRGLCPGDVVRIIVNGPYMDVAAQIRSIESDDRVLLLVDEIPVRPFAYEVALVSAKTSARVPRRKEV